MTHLLRNQLDVAASVQDAEKYRTLIESIHEPAWVKEKRKNALALYAELPVPAPPVKERNFPALSPAEVEGLFLKTSPVAGDISFSRSSSEVSPSQNPQVILRSLSEAVVADEEKIRPILGEIFKAKQNKWAALNQAIWQGGAFVHIPKNLDVGVPVLIQHNLPDAASALFPRILVLAEPGSRVVIVDHYHSRSVKPAFVSPVVEVVAMENAIVHYVQIQEWGSETHHLAAVRMHTHQHAGVTATSCMLGGKRSVNRTQVSLQGEGSQGYLLGLVFGDHDQVFENYTLQEHLARQTQSDLLLKVALKGKAYSHFDGLIWIEKGATKTSAYQQNRNLLLSNEAKADSTPRLEILDNDILGCTHGAAVGPVDDEQLFYLESRGIEKKEAEALVVEGFFDQVLSRITVESLRERLAKELSNRLRGAHG